MINKYVKIIHELEAHLNEISLENDDIISFSEQAIEVILKSFLEIKKYVLTTGFKNLEEEVLFFKELKPKIVSKLIYHNAIYKIETKKPNGGSKNIRKYYNNELSKLKRFFDNNLDFFKYYRTGSSYLDDHYFVRERHNLKLSIDSFYFEADHRFSTSHDYKVAKIIANDLIQVYLEGQLLTLEINGSSSFQQDKELPLLNWTANKTSLIELIYALHLQSAINNGNIDIKTIVKLTEKFLNIDLGDFYHTYLELKNRKINRTKFLDSIREGLQRKMDEEDEEN